MKIIIEGNAKEIAALVSEVQERRNNRPITLEIDGKTLAAASCPKNVTSPLDLVCQAALKAIDDMQKEAPV